MNARSVAGGERNTDGANCDPIREDGHGVEHVVRRLRGDRMGAGNGFPDNAAPVPEGLAVVRAQAVLVPTRLRGDGVNRRYRRSGRVGPIDRPRMLRLTALGLFLLLVWLVQLLGERIEADFRNFPVVYDSGTLYRSIAKPSISAMLDPL